MNDLRAFWEILRERPLESLVSFLVVCGGCVGIALVWL